VESKVVVKESGKREMCANRSLSLTVAHKALELHDDIVKKRCGVLVKANFFSTEFTDNSINPIEVFSK
jgi:hypothetical protein